MGTFRVVSRWFPVLLLFVLVGVFPRDVARAQVFAQQRPGEVIQQIERDRRQQELQTKEQQPPKPVVIEEKKEARPPAGAIEKILVKKIRVEGNTLLNQNEIDPIVAPYEGKELSLEDMRNVADLITAKYRDKGYLIVYAFVPQQEVKDNTVVISVLEGKVGSITVTGNKSYSASFIEKRLAVVRKDPSLKEQTLERALLLLNDNPSLDVRASLKRGKDRAETDLTGVVTDKFPVSGRLFYDNFGTSTTSKNRVGFGLNLGNLLTSGDGVSLWGITGTDKLDVNALSYGRAEYSLPLGIYGTRAGVYYAHNLYEASGDVAPLGLKGNADLGGVFVTHPLIRTRDTNLSARLGFDYKDVREYALGEILSKDKVRVATFGLGYDSTDKWLGKNFVTLTYHQGIPDFLDGTGRNDLGVSRFGAKGDFNKVTAEALRIQKLPGYNHLLLRGSGQYSSDPLFVIEQFLIGGAGSVRGFNPAENTGDIGYSLTAEAVLSPFFADRNIWGQKVGNTIQFAFFVDHGYVRRNSPLPGDYKQAYLTGIGGGVRIYAGKYLSVKADYGIPKVDSSFETRKSVIYVQTMLAF